MISNIKSISEILVLKNFRLYGKIFYYACFKKKLLYALFYDVFCREDKKDIKWNGKYVEGYLQYEQNSLYYCIL